MQTRENQDILKLRKKKKKLIRDPAQALDIASRTIRNVTEKKETNGFANKSISKRSANHRESTVHHSKTTPRAA